MNCDEVEELRDLYVLGALDSDEAEAVEEHVSGCPDCRVRVGNSWQAAQMLRLAVPTRQPAVSSRRLLREAVGGEINLRPRPFVNHGSRFLGSWRPLQIAAAVAVLPLMASLWLSSQVLALQQQVQANQVALERSWQTGQHAAEVMGKAIEHGGAVTSLVGTEMAPAANGNFYYMPGDRDAVLVVNGLPKPEPGKVYQLWLISGQQRMSGGTFYLEDDGAGMLIVKSPAPMNGVQSLGVTEEPKGGSASPVGQRYMWGNLQQT